MIIEHAYVKQSYTLSLAFFKKNLSASLVTMSVLLILVIASSLPSLRIPGFLLLSVFSFSLQMYVAKSLKEEYAEAGFSDILLRYFKLGFAAFLGQLSIEVLLGAIFFFAFSALVGMDVYEALRAGSLTQTQIFPVYMKIGFIFSIACLVLMLWVYIIPMMLAYAYEAENFVEAFLAAFVLFNPAVWKASFKEKYYVLASMLQVIALIVFASIMLLFSDLFLLPLVVFFSYLFLIYVAVVSTMAKLAVS